MTAATFGAPARPARPEAAPEHEFEAAHGLPEALPAGERLRWQGAPGACVGLSALCG